jgi:hypothetical protein
VPNRTLQCVSEGPSKVEPTQCATGKNFRGERRGQHAEFEQLELQQAEALAFLRRHHIELQSMRSVQGVETASIDFGIVMRNVVVQGDAFEPELLAEVASLRMRLVLSQYPPQGRAKRVKQYRRTLRGAA